MFITREGALFGQPQHIASELCGDVRHTHKGWKRSGAQEKHGDAEAQPGAQVPNMLGTSQ